MQGGLKDMEVKPIPDGYHSITPYLMIKNANSAIEFYKKAFNAQELFRMNGTDETIAHAELRIGDSVFMLSDEYPEMNYLSPQSIGASPFFMHLYVQDVDAVFDKAIAAGGTVLKPVEDQFYGDRSGTIKDPFGHLWSIATHKNDVPLDEIKKKSEEMFSKKASQ